MSLVVRVIPCLDVNNGRVVRGVNFENLHDTGDPVELIRCYGEEGADELTFLNITASKDGRDTVPDVVRRTASEIFIPLTIGGDVHSAEDADQLLRTGTDKVSINTTTIARLGLLGELSRRFDVQCVVPSVDACRVPKGGTSQPPDSEMTTHGGSRSIGVNAVEWTRRGGELGVGGILLDSMDDGGTKDGFGLELLEKVRTTVDVPVVVSDGMGKAEHSPPVVRAGANAMLAAPIFHSGEVSIAKVKGEMARKGIEVHQ